MGLYLEGGIFEGRYGIEEWKFRGGFFSFLSVVFFNIRVCYFIKWWVFYRKGWVNIGWMFYLECFRGNFCIWLGNNKVEFKSFYKFELFGFFIFVFFYRKWRFGFVDLFKGREWNLLIVVFKNCIWK